MIHDFNVAPVEDMRDLTRALWTASCGWDDLLGLLKDPIEFFRSQGIEIRFGDASKNIILAFTAAPKNQADDLVVEGMDDTNVVSISANWPTAGAADPTKHTIALDEEMPIIAHIVGGNATSTVHLHLKDAVNRMVDGSAYQIYLMIRYPDLLSAALTKKIGVKSHHGDPAFISVVNGDKNLAHTVGFTEAHMATALVEWDRQQKLGPICETAQCFVSVDDHGGVTHTVAHIMARIYR